MPLGLSALRSLLLLLSGKLRTDPRYGFPSGNYPRARSSSSTLELNTLDPPYIFKVTAPPESLRLRNWPLTPGGFRPYFEVYNTSVNSSGHNSVALDLPDEFVTDPTPSGTLRCSTLQNE